MDFNRGHRYTPWMLPFEIESFPTVKECVDTLPDKINNIGDNYEVYRLVGITMRHGSQVPGATGHFTALLKWKGQFLLYDGLGSKMVPYEEKDLLNRTPQLALYFLLPNRSPEGPASPGIGTPPPQQGQFRPVTPDENGEEQGQFDFDQEIVD